MTDRAPATQTGAHAPRSLLRDTFSPTWIVVGLAAAALSGFGTVMAAADGHGDTGWGLLMILSPALATAISVLALLGDTDELIRRYTFRTTVYSAAVTLVSVIVGFVVTLLPVTAGAIASTSKPDGWHYWFDGGTYPILLTLLAGWGAALLASLLVLVLIVVPVLAIRRPRDFAKANMLSTEQRHYERNRRAGIAFAFLLILIFAIPTLIVVGAQTASADDIGELFADFGRVLQAPLENLGEIAWMLGLLLIPVAVWLTWYVYKTQRIDRAARARSGVPMGLERPDDD